MTTPETVASYLGLCKATISLFAALSTVAGFFLADGPLGEALAASTVGVFLMACGASALNHYQERRSDALMPRTAGRPIPSGRVRPEAALRFSLVLIGSGAAALLATGAGTALLLGLAAVLWYNGLYTWLKARNAFAAIPGAVIGAIPPAIGWTAAGGCCDPRLGAVCFFFFMWQVPHFLIHQHAFGKEYEKIRLPSLTAVFTGAQIDRLTFQWLLTAAVSLQLLVFYGLTRSPFVNISLIAASVWIAARGGLLLTKWRPDYPGLFLSTNRFMLATTFLIVLDRVPPFLAR